MRSPALSIEFCSALVMAIFALLSYQAMNAGGEVLWDFETYYAAARAFRDGLDPYDLELLSTVMGHELTHPYVYPPWSLYAFLPLAQFDYSEAVGYFLAFKTLCIGALAVLWQCWFGRHPLLLLLMPLAYAGAAMADLESGNVDVVVQLCIWLGLAAYKCGRYCSFTALILAAASVKLLPLAFLGMLLIGTGERRYLRLLLALLASAGFFLIQAWANPALFSSFVDAVALVDERGSINPCSYAYWGSLLHFAEVRDLPLGGQLARWALYVVTTCLVIALSWWAWARTYSWQMGWRVPILAVLTYALSAPRFKDYSYGLLIPAAYVFCLSLGKGWRPWVAGIAICLPTRFLIQVESDAIRGLLSYYPLFCAFALWGFALAQCRGNMRLGQSPENSAMPMPREQ